MDDAWTSWTREWTSWKARGSIEFVGEPSHAGVNDEPKHEWNDNKVNCLSGGLGGNEC